MLVVEWKNIAISASPFIGYLLIFKYYATLRQITGLDEFNKPNSDILPWLDQAIFQCLPHRLLSTHPNFVLDVLAAIPYLIHFPLPVLFALYLYLNHRRRRQIYAFLWCAGWVNLLAVIVQLLFPTAPPWFTDSVVYDENGQFVSSGNNEAGFERLDKLLDIKMFHNIYGASPVKFGAMPSLHVAWPAIILVCKPWVSSQFGIFHVVWIAWAAMYSNHHYAIDAVAGILLALTVNICMMRVYCPFPPVSIFRPDDDDARPRPAFRKPNSFLPL
jgi:membrane-associated phospholipid phosphatase